LRLFKKWVHHAYFFKEIDIILYRMRSQNLVLLQEDTF
jgi:hypothetical protein